MEEERNELVNEEKETELSAEEKKVTENGIKDRFTEGLMTGGAVVLIGVVGAKGVKKGITWAWNKFKGTKLYDKARKHAEPEESDEPIDVESSEVETEEEE